MSSSQISFIYKDQEQNFYGLRLFLNTEGWTNRLHLANAACFVRRVEPSILRRHAFGSSRNLFSSPTKKIACRAKRMSAKEATQISLS